MPNPFKRLYDQATAVGTLAKAANPALAYVPGPVGDIAGLGEDIEMVRKDPSPTNFGFLAAGAVVPGSGAKLKKLASKMVENDRLWREAVRIQKMVSQQGDSLASLKKGSLLEPITNQIRRLEDIKTKIQLRYTDLDKQFDELAKPLLESKTLQNFDLNSLRRGYMQEAEQDLLRKQVDTRGQYLIKK